MSLEGLRGVGHGQEGVAVLALKLGLLRAPLPSRAHLHLAPAVVLAAALHLLQLVDGALACVSDTIDLEHLDGRDRSSLPRVCHQVYEVNIRLRHPRLYTTKEVQPLAVEVLSKLLKGLRRCC